MNFDKRAYWEGVLGDGTRPPATDFVGFDLIAFDETAGCAEAAFCLPDQAKNPAGNAQGGFITAALDEVMSVAGSIVQDGPAMAPTLQMTVSFIRPVPVGVRLIGRGEVVRKGKAAIFTQGTLRLEDGTLLAQATASCIPRSLA
ncbi:MAG TPA: PaaI family thioesterase [Hyphomonas sp.]|nr:PaaI family thioesterase [Hyphomonas sp.]HRX74440.1 PaaI family thioesterase [Hyphomonas sp.]